MLTYPDYKEKNIIICNTSEKQKLSFQNDNIIIKDENDKIILQSTCYKLFSLWIIGSITITSGILERSKKFAFSIYMFNFNFKCYGVWSSSTEGNFILRHKQYHHTCILPAKKIVENKILNQLNQLKSIRIKNVVQQRAVASLTMYLSQIDSCDTIPSVMGVEGISSKVYFESWFYDLDWKGRKPRAKMDVLNVLLDIGYTYLFNIIESMLNLYGFDLYKGILHQNFYQRKSLVCDMVEPFRVIIDRVLKNAYNLKQINEDDFVFKAGQYILKYDKSKVYTKFILNAILEHKAEIFLFVQEYYRWFMKGKPIHDFPIFKFDK